MNKNMRKISLGLVVLVSLLGNLALVLGLGRGLPSHAQSPGVSAADYWIASGQDPWGTTFDSSGNVWVAVPGCDPSPMCSSSTPPGKIEAFNPASTSWIATYQLPTGFGQPLFVQFDASGNLWFAMPMSNSIGMLNPQTDTFQQFAVPTAGAGPWGLAIDHNGNIWFTEHYTNQIGEFIPSSNTMKEFATPTANSLPYGIAVDASNNIWFTENNSSVAQIGEYTAGGTMLEYKIRSSLPCCLTPHLITVDPNGNVWWTEGWVGMLGELQVSKAAPGTNNGVTEYAYPISCTTCQEHTSGIKVDGYGQVWFDDALQGIFGSFPDSGQGSFSTYPAPTQQHPHDGLNVDSQNRIWFTEEFANKLAVATQSGPPPSPTPGSSPSPSPSAMPSPGTSLAQDSFQRPNQALWGTASDGHTWGGDANTQSAFSIVSNTGQLSNTNGVYNAILGPTATDAEVLFSGSMSSFSNANLGGVSRWTDSNNWYKAYINGTNLVVQKKVNGTTTTIGSAPFTATAGISYTLRFRVVGTTLSARVWQTGTTEPTSWTVTVTDTTFSSGNCGLRAQVASGVTASYTSFLATVPAGTPTPTPSPGPSPSPSPAMSPSPAVSPSPGTTLAQDTFQRANQQHWGQASDGQTWGGDANTSGVFSINSNAGQLSNGGSNVYNAVLGPSATNAEVIFSGSMSSFNNTNLGAVLRWTDTNDWYKAYISGTSLVLQKKVNGTTTTLKTVPFAAAAGTSYTIDFSIVGTTLSANVWQTGTSEPSGWMVSVTDSSISSGFCGLRIQLQSGATAAITSFQALS